MNFKYFVIFAEMRTGSNFLEASINSFDDLHCYGEVYNPSFVGHHNKSDLFGIDQKAREAQPLSLINKMIEKTEGLPGFRFFNDHDPRVMAHVLADPNCGKIILTRNPLESYVSWKIAQETGQWRLSDVRQRKASMIDFDKDEFLDQLDQKRAFQLDILKALQTSGQTAFYIAYEDIGETEVLNGLARYLGSKEQIDGAAKSTKKQNPSGLEDKVNNYEEMVAQLASADHFALSNTPNFEPRRGPGVPGFVAGNKTPLLYIPIKTGPYQRVLEWLISLEGGTSSDLITGFSQKDLRQWKKQRPGYRAFTVLRHPLARAHHVFSNYILPKGQPNFEEPRRILRNKYGVDIPKDGNLDGYSLEDHKAAFGKFLTFLKGNLAGQTSIRVDAVWATQSSLLEGAAIVALPDIIIREHELAKQLERLAQDVGSEPMILQSPSQDAPYTLAQIYDADLEKRCFQAYRRDYLSFGFSDWSEKEALEKL